MRDDLPAGVDIEYELTRLVKRLRRRAFGTINELHPKLDYGTYLYFIAICDADGDVRGADLAEIMGVHKSTASRAVATLVRLGLVHQLPDPLDGRARRLVADDAAVAKLQDYRRRGQERLELLLSDWTSDEVAAFAQSLRRYNDAGETAGDF